MHALRHLHHTTKKRVLTGLKRKARVREWGQSVPRSRTFRRANSEYSSWNSKGAHLRIFSPYFVALLPILASLCGCHPGETGDEVPDSGYVDLEAPISYSPKRGVICESFGINIATKAYEGICYDTLGPSVPLTAKHIPSDDAWRVLEAKLSAGQLKRGRPFTLGNDITCYPDAHVCRYGPSFLPAFLRPVALRYSKGLFGGVHT